MSWDTGTYITSVNSVLNPCWPNGISHPYHLAQSLSILRRCFFCGSFLLFRFCVCHALLSVLCSLAVTFWKRAGLLAFLVCDVFLCFCHFPMWCPGLGVVLYCTDFFLSLTPFLLCYGIFIEDSVSKQWRPCSVAADLGLHCFPMYLQKEARLIWFNCTCTFVQCVQ